AGNLVHHRCVLGLVPLLEHGSIGGRRIQDDQLRHRLTPLNGEEPSNPSTGERTYNPRQLRGSSMPASIDAKHLLSAGVLIALVLPPVSAAAQWTKIPSANVPRTADGKPDLSAPAPRLP